MRSFRTFRFTAAAIVALLVASAPALAQGGPGSGPGGGPGGWGPGMMMWPGMMRGPGMWGPGGPGSFCNPRMAGFAEWRIDQIERVVKPNETQRKALQDLRAASAKAAEMIAAACPQQAPATTSERLSVMEKRMETMLQAIKTTRPAFDAFYGTLSDEQKQRLDASGPRQWGWGRWRQGVR